MASTGRISRTCKTFWLRHFNGRRFVMKEVKFVFDVGDKVKTMFDETGVVENCAIDDSGINKYFVKVKDRPCWYKESEIRSA